MNVIVEKVNRQATDYWHHLKLFSRNSRLFLWGSFFAGLTFAAYQLLFNLYLREQGAAESFIGNMLSGGAVGMAAATIPAAFLLRKIRLKPILIVTIILYGAAVILMTWLPVNEYLFFIVLFSGTAATFYRVAAAPFFMRNSTPRERTYIFSSAFGVALIASMVGSLLFGWLVPQFEKISGNTITAYRWTFAISVFLGLLSLIPFLMIKATGPKREDRNADFSRTLLKKQAGLYFRLSFPYFIVGIGAGLIIPFLNIYFRDQFGQPPNKIGLFYFLANSTMLIGIMAGPVLARKLGMVRTIVWTQLMSIPFMLLLAYTTNLHVAIFAFLVRGALMNLGQPIGTNFGMEVVSESEHALVNALLMLAWTGSWMISASVGGWLIEKYGYTPPFMITIILYILSSVLYYLYFRRYERKTDSGFAVDFAGKEA